MDATIGRVTTGATLQDLAVELQKIYDSEINIRISWLWDGRIDVMLGDEVNGYPAAENVQSVKGIVPWLQDAIAHFYPDSIYAQSLAADVRERAAKQLFRPPEIGAQVISPHCGTPHAAPPGMSTLIAFICPRCGNAVEVAPPTVQ